MSTKPLRGPKNRSRAFQEYLLRQTPERAAAIMVGEKAFNELTSDKGSVAQAAERDYAEIMESTAGNFGPDALSRALLQMTNRETA